jgi:hypothetical protein
LGRTKTPSADAIKRFYLDLARKVVETGERIEISGVVYSGEWSTGVIRDKFVGKIPKHLLLLLLREQRLAKNDANALIVKDLDLICALKKAIKSWNLTKKYPRVATCAGISSFASNQKNCLKCIIFVARAWHCCQLLEEGIVDSSLNSKICDCLSILEINYKRVSSVASSTAEVLLAATPPQTLQTSTPDDTSTANSGGISHDLFASRPCSDPKDGKILPSNTSIPARPQQTQLLSPATSHNFRENPASQLWYEDQVSGETTLSAYERKHYWYPMDPQEMILNPTEIEMAWLLEESLYCTRKKNVNWTFIFKFASPTLKTQLRKLPPPVAVDGDHDDDDKERLGSLIRMDFPVVEKRFRVVRHDVRNRLICRETRPAMKTIVPQLRRFTHPLSVKRRRMAVVNNLGQE